MKSNFDPFNAVTYRCEIEVLFEGFEETNLAFFLVFANDEDAYIECGPRINERLRIAFKNVVSYKVLSVKKARPEEQSRPMC